MTNWESLLSNRKNQQIVSNFASGDVSGEEFYRKFKNTELGGTVRNLFRTYGVAYSKRLARKALNRRGLV